MRSFREASIAFRRAPLLSALSITTIAFSLFAFGLFGLVALNIRSALRSVESRVEIRAFIGEGTPIEAVSAAMGDIAAFPEVFNVEYVSPEEALEVARRELREFRDVYEAGFLPASVDVVMREGYRDPVTVEAVAARLRTYPFVDDVVYGQEWIEKLSRIQQIATVVGAILGLVFAAVATIIIGASIRMTVLARSREIAIMRLVGATDGFIRRPFLLDGFVKGVLGGALALLLTWLAHRLISANVIETVFFDQRIAALGILFGAIIGLLGSAVSVGRHLRRI